LEFIFISVSLIFLDTTKLTQKINQTFMSPANFFNSILDNFNFFLLEGGEEHVDVVLLLYYCFVIVFCIVNKFINASTTTRAASIYSLFILFCYCIFLFKIFLKFSVSL